MKILMNLGQQIKLIFKELQQVEWLSWQDTVKSTTLVLVISFFVGIIIVALDAIFFKTRNLITNL